jgi:GDPmannose 4,6-dehydratase
MPAKAKASMKQTGTSVAQPGAGPKRALVTGVTGQDGSYLAELLIEKGYAVHGVIRRSSSFNTARLDHLYQDPVLGKGGKGGKGGRGAARGSLHLHYGDITDSNTLAVLMRTVHPHEVYNLAAQSHVRVSFDQPVYTSETVAVGAVRLLEAVREYQHETGRQVRYYQASSSEQYGRVLEVPQRETTPFYPRSPYACAKVMAHYATVNYRESFGLHASCGILFNHESPRRGETFVTRKITRAVGRIKMGLQEKVVLGNLDSRRDWGFAGDYVEAMWLMLQRDEPDDYVVATGRQISVKDFAEMAFAYAGLSFKRHLAFDARYTRPAEVDSLLGDATKARRKLGWKPRTTIEELARMMVEHDLELARRERTLRDAGHALPRGNGHDQ